MKISAIPGDFAIGGDGDGDDNSEADSAAAHALSIHEHMAGHGGDKKITDPSIVTVIILLQTLRSRK